MEPKKVLVDYVSLQPGNPHNIYVLGDDGDKNNVFSFGDAGVVTCDGERVDVGELFAWLAAAKGKVYATLHPLAERYGLSLRTDFTTE